MTPVIVRRFIVLTLCVGFATASDHAQTPATQTIEFVAVAAEGGVVADLTPSHVSLKVGGKDRPVTSLELVRYDSPTSVLPAPFATNAAADAGRDFVVVVDEESMRPGTENAVRESLVAFASSLPARDRLGLFTVPRGSQSVAPTTDRARFLAAVSAIQGRLPAVGSTRGTGSGGGIGGAGVTGGCHARDVLAALGSIVSATARPIAPTPVILVSSTISGPESGPTSLAQSEECRISPREFQALGQAVDGARAQMFVVRPQEGEATGRSEGLENLAGVTGGQILGLGRTGDDALVRIGRSTGAYYVATFAVEPAERNGLSHRVELRSTRPDITLRSRAGVVIPRADRDGALTPQSMLRSPTVHRGFGLRWLVVASRNDGDAKNPAKLVGLAQPIDPSVKITAAAAGVYDTASKLITQWTAKPEELQRSPMAAAVVVPSGTYRVRVAAIDAQGRAATADYDINTEMVSAGVAHLGGLLIGTANPGFMPQLEFSSEPEITVYFELYGRPAGPFGALVELAETADGPALSSVQPTPAATPVQDKFMFTAKLPIASLKPGDYQVRAKLAFEGQPTGVLLRTIRKK
jgi:hypothetical protein